MEHYDLGFVVLHYLAYDMTINCVNSLLDTFKNNKIKIVIVDNFSLNKSGERLHRYYKDNTDVDVILNLENQGFAKGNNVGYNFLKEIGYFKYMVVLNNDIIISDNNFYNKIVRIDSEYNFSVLGPDIYNPLLNFHQSPSRRDGITLSQVEQEKTVYEKRLKNLFLYVLIDSLKKNCKKLINVFFSKKNKTKKINEYVINPVLHGACYIFSEKFIKSRNYAFYPETFLYFEEEILYYECIKNNMLMIYSPEISVVHYEDVSTNMAFKNAFKKERVKILRILDSMQIFMKLASEKNM